MKIKSNMKNSFFKNYNEAKGIALSKKKILKNNTNKVPTYLTYILITIILLCSITILSYHLDKTKTIGTLYLITLIIYIFYVISRTIWSYKFRKKQDYQNIIILDEEGLTDKSFYGIKITFTWDKIKAFVIKKYTITVLTDTNLYFFFDIKEKEEILKAIEKYHNSAIIIKE